MHHQFKRLSYLRSSTTQLPSNVSASHRRTVVGPSIVFHFFSSSVCLFLRTVLLSVCLSFVSPFPLGVPKLCNLRLFFLLLFLHIRFCALANFGKCLHVLASTCYHQGIHYPALTCKLAPAFTPRCCSRLCSCVSACSRHSGIIKGYSTALE